MLRTAVGRSSAFVNYFDFGSRWCLFCIFCILNGISFVKCADFPAPITKCHMGDEECIIRQANQFIHAHPHGLTELDIPDMEPFTLGKVPITTNNQPQSSGGFRMELSDIKLYNYSTYISTSFKGFTKDGFTKPMKIATVGHVSHMLLKADYKVDGKVLVLPIKGEGELECRLTNVTIKTKSTTKPVKRDDGKIYLNIVDYKLISKMDNLNIHMTNLFNGDKTLSENILKVLNDNWRLLSDDYTAIINDAISKLNHNTIQNILKDVPYEDFFLPED